MKEPKKHGVASPGCAYVQDRKGRWLPVVDITQTAFSIDENPQVWDRLLADYEADVRRRAGMPPWLRKLVLSLVLRKSVLASGLRKGRGTYLGGLDTYLFKLGPYHLDPAWSSPVDRMIASSLPGFSVRSRLVDTAGLLADGLQSLPPGDDPVVLVNLAGGTGADSFNALLLWAKSVSVENLPPVKVKVLDLGTEGPELGASALGVLQASGRALEGLEASWEILPWDWNSQDAGKVLDGAVGNGPGGCSSEGGLFDYASDSVVLDLLRVLAGVGGPFFFVVGTLSRDDGPAASLNHGAGMPVVPRSLDGFRSLAAQAGWTLGPTVSRPLYHAFRLVKSTGL